MAPERLAGHYAAIGERCRELLGRDADLDDLGERPDRLVRLLERGELESFFDPARFSAGFATSERALDTERLAIALRRAAAASPRVTFVPFRVARAIAPEGNGFRVEGDGAEGRWSLQAGQLVNATWEGRLALDRQLGMPPPENLLHRLKYRVIARLPAELRGWSHEVEPPAEWNAACRGEVDGALAREVAAGILAGIDGWYPGMGRSEPLLVDAGAIVALRRNDVEDASSDLHDRTRIGVTSRRGITPWIRAS